MLYRILGFLRFGLICLVTSVVVYFAYLGYVKLGGHEKRLSLFGKPEYTFETFLNNLYDKNTPNYNEHLRLYETLKDIRQSQMGGIQNNPDIPNDYKHFFQEVAPRFVKNTGGTPTNPEGAGPILTTFGREADYVTTLLLLSGPEGRILNGQRKVKGYTKRLEMTGTYTSSFQHPTGLFAIDGEVINPVLQSWVGLVIIDSEGKVQVKDINMLEYQFRHFDIQHSYQDYLDFLDLVNDLKLSLLQSHLIVKHGEIDVSPDNTKRFRRRVIFQDASSAVSIYDSFERHLTLYETAEILVKEYQAVNAVNLDMGPYGYCARYENEERVRLYGGKGKGIQLSNIMIFNYN